MAVKYRIDYRNHDNVPCRVDISTISYEGDPILVRSQQDNACIVSYNGGSDPFHPIVNSNASVNLINEGQIDVFELQTAGDRDFRVLVYVDNMSIPFWQGFLIPDGIQNSFMASPYTLSLTATDGLKLLEEMDFQYVAPIGGGLPTIASVVNRIFGNFNLGLQLDIFWNIDMPSTDKDNNTVAFQDRELVEEFFLSFADDGNTEKRKCMWILEGILKAASSRIFQRGNAWVIEQVLLNDLKPTVNIGRDGMVLVNNDAYITIDRGLKGVDVTYNFTKNGNALTNGNFDKVDSVTELPVNWIVTDPHDPDTKSSYFGYNNRNDNGIQVAGDTLTSEKLNIDSHSVFKSIGITFDYSPKSGFPVDAEGYLNNDNVVMFSLAVAYVTYGSGYYLNEFPDVWVPAPEKWYSLTENGYFKENAIGTIIPINFTLQDIARGKQLKLDDVIQVSFDRFGDIQLPNPFDIDKSPVTPESYLLFQIFESSMAGTVSMYGNLLVSTENLRDMYKISQGSTEYTDRLDVDLNVSTSFNSFINSDLKGDYASTNKTYRFNVFGNKLSLSESVGYQMLRMRQKPCVKLNGSLRLSENVPSWWYGEMYEVDGMIGKKFMPLSMNYNIEMCQIKADLYEFRNEGVTGLEIVHVGGDVVEEE